MSRASSSQMPDASALPDRLTPSGPGNISGNSVRMVARQFMYERSAPGQLAALAAEGLLDLGKIVVTTFALADFKRAVEAAALMQGLDLTAVVP